MHVYFRPASKHEVVHAQCGSCAQDSKHQNYILLHMITRWLALVIFRAALCLMLSAYANMNAISSSPDRSWPRAWRHRDDLLMYDTYEQSLQPSVGPISCS